MPEPTTVASNNAVPMASAANLRGRSLIGRVLCKPCVKAVMGDLAVGHECFPGYIIGVAHPCLRGACVAAFGPGLLEGQLARRLQSILNLLQLGHRIGLQSDVIDSRCSGRQTNGKIEAFFKITKNEFMNPNKFDSLEDLIRHLGNYLFEYNHLRKHGGLNYQSPFDKLKMVTELLS